jgi:uncharacterized repeat protein (TIGR02543 family)
MQMGPTEYSGFGTVTLSMTESIETSMTRSRTETVSNSVLISESLTDNKSIENSTTWKASGSLELKKVFKVEAGVEKTLKNSSGTSRTVEVSNGKSKETSESFMTSISQSLTNSTLFTIDRGDPVGHYRYAWYTVSDVYFIISTSLDNQELLSWDVISCARGAPSGRLELSSDGKFDNSPIKGTEIVFADDFYKTLSKPPTSSQYVLITNAMEGGKVSHNPNQTSYNFGTQVTVTAVPDAGYVFNGWTGAPSGVNASNASITFAINSNLALTANFRRAIEKTETKEFTTAGNHIYTFDKGFPATIEVYALGAGGGGQGGHENGWMGDGGSNGAGHERGTGGAGGGGAAAYIKFSLEQSTIITIKVGRGGTYGSGSNKAHWLPINKDDNWTSGTPGNDGENTTVQAGSTILIANGGKGGGGAGRTEIHGGNGGTASRPSAVPESNWATTPGNKGTDGIRNGNQVSRGGNSGRLIIGSSDIGGSKGEGGASSYGNNIGSVGIDGEVKIVITYYE